MAFGHFYVLDDQHRIIDVGDDINRWGRFFQSKERVVAHTYVGAARAWWVSTVFLGMDHGFGETEKPLLFETMVFWQGKAPIESEWSGYQDRWCTWDEAMAGHERICHELALTIMAADTAEQEAIGQLRKG